MKTALQDWLNPEEASEEGGLLDGPATDFEPTQDAGYTLNIKKKEEVSDSDFEDLFKD